MTSVENNIMEKGVGQWWSVNGAIIRFAPDMTRDQVELQRVMLINQDPPDHTKLRQVISRGFTPRAINALRQSVVTANAALLGKRIPHLAGSYVIGLV